MAKREEIGRKEIILISIAIALSTALIGYFQELFDEFAEILPESWRPVAWVVSVFVWILIVILMVSFFVWAFGYNVRKEKE